jgi:WD40 repeat protein
MLYVPLGASGPGLNSKWALIYMVRLLISGLLLIRWRERGREFGMPSAAEYDAFISYSHRLDQLGPQLQSGLQRFAKPWYRLRALRVFCDTANLSANPGLWESIEEALSNSRWFLLLTSADAAQSHWVNREVEWWLAHRSPDHLLIAATGPGLAWDKQSQDWAVDAPVPPALRGAFRSEPLWVDLSDMDVNERKPVVPPERIAALAAPLRGAPMDTLIGEHLREYRRAWRHAKTAIALLTALVVATSVATVIAFQLRGTAIAQRDQAVHNEIFAEADELSSTNSALAAQRNLQAYRMMPNQDGYTRLLNTEDTPLATRLVTDHGPVQAVAVNGDIMASGNHNGTVQLWDTANPAAPRALGRPLTGTTGSVNTLALSKNGVGLISGDAGGTIRVWNVQNPAHPTVLGNLISGISSVFTVALSPDGRLLAAGSGDGSTRLWDLANHNHLVILDQPASGEITLSLAFSPSGDILAVGKVNGQINGAVELWNVQNPARPRLIDTINYPGSGPLQPVAFSPDGRTLAAGTIVGLVLLWDVTDPARPQASVGKPLQGAGDTTSLQFSPDGNLLAAGSSDGTTRVWDVVGGINSPPQLGQPFTAGAEGVNGMAFTPDGRTLITGNQDGTIRLWHLPATVLTADTLSVSSVNFSSQGHLLATGSDDGTVRLWDVLNPDSPRLIGRPLIITGSPSDITTAARFSPDGQTLAGANGSTIRLWNISNPADPRLLTSIQEASSVQTVAFGEDGHLLAGAETNGMIQFWSVGNPADPRPVGKPFTGNEGGHPVFSIAFDPHGDLLASGGYDDTVRLWNISNPARPQLIGQLTGNTGPVDSVTFGPDGRYLADAGYDGSVHLWDISNPRRPQALPTLTGGTAPVGSVAFSPDGHMIASGDYDDVVRLWDFSHPKQPRAIGQPLTGQTDNVLSVAFSPDGRTLASGSDDATVYLWDLNVTSAENRICQSDGGELTVQQWNHYVQQLPYRSPCAGEPR